MFAQTVVPLEYFWLVVWKKYTGEFLNAYVYDRPEKDLQEVISRFEKNNNLLYEVLDSGIGEENRPNPVKNLRYIN